VFALDVTSPSGVLRVEVASGRREASMEAADGIFWELKRHMKVNDSRCPK
jgi:hypothetical protein